MIVHPTLHPSLYVSLVKVESFSFPFASMSVSIVFLLMSALLLFSWNVDGREIIVSMRYDEEALSSTLFRISGFVSLNTQCIRA
jgi:hypothetical protein